MGEGDEGVCRLWNMQHSRRPEKRDLDFAHLVALSFALARGAGSHKIDHDRHTGLVKRQYALQHDCVQRL